MAIAVDWDAKPQTKQNKRIICLNFFCLYIYRILQSCLATLQLNIHMCEHDNIWSSLNQHADKLKFESGTCDSVGT